MSYQALYRKYRPTDFDSVSGQEHVVKALKNALRQDKIVHAYLFSGPRGIGKTTIARIFAKTVNCKCAPTDKACNECENCIAISNGEFNDIIEIDAASNNSVDEIRELRDKVKYLPSSGRYKVYIIDEVHMLTTQAFNALLKTLEEPPKHVIFILCTTEAHKIPLTIQSRCQRFDFRAINQEEISNKLLEIAELENIQIDKDAVDLISLEADGGMRDALSLLDQSIAYGNEKISVDDVLAVSGKVSTQTLVRIVEFIKEKDSINAIKELNKLLSLGKEVPKILNSLINFYKDLLMYKNIGESYASRLLVNEPGFINLSRELSNATMYVNIDILSKTQNDIKFAANQKLYLELALIKMTDKEENSQTSLLTRLNDVEMKIEELLKNGVEIKKEEKAPLINLDIVEEEIIEPTPELVVEVEKPQEEEKEEPIIEVKEEPVVEENIEPVQEEVLVEEPQEETPSFDLFEEEISDISNTYDIHFVEDVLNHGNRMHKEELKEGWKDIKRRVNHMDAAYLEKVEDGQVVASNGEKIIITFEDASYCNLIMKPENKSRIEEALSKAFSGSIKYMALPNEVWKEVSTEFMDEYRKLSPVERGNLNISLKPINHPDLRDVSIKEEKEENKDFEDVIDIFGKDFIKYD